jgi:asparagine synthase (glutamine-hydrolysing)
MCGIFGIWNRNRAPAQPEAIRAMADALIHRGPDGEGVWMPPGRGVVLGNRRLAIIDIAGGNQPFVSDDGLIAVVQNGEIFNYVELAAELRAQGVVLKSDSDTEVILRIYEREGIAGISRLNGMFAIAIDDARQDCIYLVRDRIGKKPFYYFDDGQTLGFASEIKSLESYGKKGLLPSTNRALFAIDFEAIHHYLSFNYIPAPWTIHQGVKHLMPGCWLRVGRQAGAAGVTVQRYWSLADQTEREHTFDAWQEEFMATLDDATRIRMRSDVPWGAFLSGGVDSTSIVGLMARHTSQPVKTFSIGFEDPRYDESPFAAEAARRFGCSHINEIAELNMLKRWPHVLYHLDQPHGDASFMPTLRVSELAAKHVKVVLTGDGGDELFAGYEKYEQFFNRPDAFASDAASFQRRYFDSISLFSPAGKAALYTPDMAAKVAGLDSFDAAAKPWFDQAQHFDRINQALYLDMQLLLSGNNLVKPDRMGMAVSIEARTPFLDWRMMELAFRSRGRTKLSEQGDKKHWYKKAVTPLIGEDLAYRKKQMFTVPIGEWFKNESYSWLHDLLSKSELLNQTIRWATVEKMLENHKSGQANHTRELRALAALALWHQRAA